MKSEIRYYVSVFLRRFHYFLIVFTAIAVASIATALVLPPVYRSTATLLVESPQIPTDLAESTVQGSRQEQLEIIRQRLMTRANLLEIEREVGLLPDRASMSADEVVRAIRERTSISIRTGRDRATLFEISFGDANSGKALAVVNAYVTRVLEDNVQLRTNRAEGTMDFFEQEVVRLAADLERQSARILEFKNNNLGALPDDLGYLNERRGDLRDRLASIRREITSLEQQKERLIVVANVNRNTPEQLSPDERRLRELEAELGSLLAIYSEANPKVRAVQTQIDALQANMENTAQPEAEEAPTSSILELQLREIDASRTALLDEIDRIEEEIVSINERLSVIPENSIRLEKLNRDYAAIQRQYERTVERASTAETGERIELLSKGERISVLNQPVRATEPTSPNRKKIAAAGVVLAAGAAFGLVFLIEFLNGSIRRPVDLTRSLGITPFATIPMMRTPGELVRRRAAILSSLAVVSAGAFGVVFYTHTQIMPLDLIAEKAVERMGL